MILQSLASHYDRLASDPESGCARPGFSREKVHFALVIDKDGRLAQVLDLRQQAGRRQVPREVIVPQGPKKSVNIAASFLWGNTAYVLGADDKGKPVRTADCHRVFKELHRTLLGSSSDGGARAVLRFLDGWSPEDATRLEHWQDMLKSNLVFQLDGEAQFVHERPAMMSIWNASLSDDEKGARGVCLVSGERAPIARLHPAIKGVRDAQSSGAAVVSFNLNAFWSYGKEQNYNAPISETRAFAYATALNHLLRSGSRNRIQIGNATTVFWTEWDSPVEGFFGMVLDPRDSAGDDRELGVFLEAIREGKLPPEIDPTVRFYILGLSPNAARLSVRFWHASTVADVSDKLGQHFRDLAMIRSFDNEPVFPGMWHLLRETCNRKSDDGPAPLLGGALMQAILNGTLYPQALLSAVLGRIRAEQNINYLRAAIIRAVLVRKARILKQGLEAPMALDRENKNVAYLLGRLFAVLEKTQLEAHSDESGRPRINTTIKDRFYGSASATPRIVFPQLLRLAQHHLPKIEKPEYRRVRDKQIEEIICNVQEFPPHLGLDQQGLFAIGYYQQRQDFFKKNAN